MVRQEWLAEAKRHEELAQVLLEADDIGMLYDYHCHAADICRALACDAEDEIAE